MYYKSDKINGVLFDAIDEQKIWYKKIKNKTGTDDDVWSDLLGHIARQCEIKLGGLHWSHMRDEAYVIRRA